MENNSRLLSKPFEESSVTGTPLPRFYVAGDILSKANGNPGLVDTTTSTPFDYIAKFTNAALISGASQLYNIIPTLGNMIGGNMEYLNPEDIMQGIDSNLAQFYTEHKEGADLVGFMLSSVIPGTAGVKIANAGLKGLRGAAIAGKVGSNIGKSMGLLPPPAKSLIATAVKEVATNTSPAALTNATALKAIAAGAGSGFVDAAMFEIGVAATMHHSPVLENQDMGDIISNIVWGGGLFGVFGGTIAATSLNAELKSARTAAEHFAKPWQHIEEPAIKSTPFEKLTSYYEQLSGMPDIPTNLDPNRISYLEAARSTKVTTLENKIRTLMGEISNGDEVVADSLYKTLKNNQARMQQANTIGLMESSTLTQKPRYAARLDTLKNKIDSGKATIDEQYEYYNSGIQFGYVKIWGENAGNFTGDIPHSTQISDTLKKGQTIIVKDNKVRITGTDRKWEFNLKFNRTPKTPYPKGKEPAPWTVHTAKNTFEANARYIWAMSLPKFKEGEGLIIHVDDFPLMEKVIKDLPKEEIAKVRFTGLKEGEYDNVKDNIAGFLAQRKLEAANKLLEVRGEQSLRKTGKYTQDDIATILNIRSSVLNGEYVPDATNLLSSRDLMALQSYAEDYTKFLVSKGEWQQDKGLVQIWKLPQHLKLVYDTKPAGMQELAGLNNHVAENLVILKEQQRLYQDGGDRAAAFVLKEDYTKFEDLRGGQVNPNDSRYGTVREGASSEGAGPSFFGAGSHNYGSLAAKAENIGKTTEAVIEKHKKAARDVLTPFVYDLTKNKEAAIEWAVLNQKLRSIPIPYTLDDEGKQFIPVALKRWRMAAAEAEASGAAVPNPPNISAEFPLEIPFKHDEVLALARAHTEINGATSIDLATIRAAQGLKFHRDPLTFYPIPVDPREYPYFAMVTDRSVTGSQAKMLYANSADELDTMIRKLKENPHLEVRTKLETEEYFKARGQFEFEKTLSDNYIDMEAHRKGISAPFLVQTDPNKIASDFMQWHMNRQTGKIREAVSAKYETVFEELKRLGDQYTSSATSKFGRLSLYDFAEEVVKNPYIDYIKTSLAIKKTADYPFLTNLNKMADERISVLYNKIADVFKSAKSLEDMSTINTYLEEAGFTGVKYTPDMELFANARANKGVLNKAVTRANSLLATVILRWDPLNAINNSVSANVLLGTETNAVIAAIKRGDKNAVGKLAELAYIKVPGTNETILAPQKLIARAMSKFSTNSTDFAFYKENNYITRIADQYRDILDDIAFTGNESVDTWMSRLNGTFKKAKAMADRGEIITGNKLAEEFNRFVAADTMKQLTDIAVEHNIMSPKEALSYINTFVNRTQGNYMAAQRPMLFHGPLGQAIGLFQTYQFNLMQQLLRHVGEGRTKDAMILLGLQGTIHGMNGLPAFNAINTHIIGNASGNIEHKDAFSSVYGIAGKEAGDWLMYGIGSNALGLIDPALKLNLYSRGDINPRHVTVIPTNPADVPIVAASAKFFGNLFQTVGTLMGGGDITKTLLQGLEHNGISRPLAGLAQTLEGLDNPYRASYSTSRSGNVMASNDLLSLANLGRIAGGKPLDEAIALDATYRFKAYALKDYARRNALGAVIKTKMIAGNYPTPDEIDEFAQKYVEAGGRITEFNQWFATLYTTVNSSQANELQRSLSSPFAQSMQRIMGGTELKDFTNYTAE